MRKILTFLFAALMSVGMFALTPKGTDTWDETTKTLAVNSNPGSYAYSNNQEIKHVIISDAVTSIGDYAFEGCYGLTSVTIGNSVESIGEGAFYSCEGLTSIEIPNSVESIGGYAFDFCTDLTSVTIGNSVTSIGERAFRGCSGLTSVTIPNSVTSIGVDAFYGCENITDVYCYPNAANLTWNEDSEDDFKGSKATHCHVHADQLSAYQSKFTGEVNVTFVGDLPATVTVTGVTLNQNEAQMTVGGETLTLTATVNPNNATDKSVTWSTSDGNVATVNNGVVTAVAAGTATITVTTNDGSYTATCDVTVTTPAPTGFDITANLDPQNAGVYYSTFYHGSVDYALPANVKAYKAVISGSNLLLSEVAAEGDVLPKGNAVILRSSDQNYTLTPSDATPVSVGDDNDLEGTDDAIPTPANNCYVLSCENNLVGFYQYGAANLNPHKAYVLFSGSNNAPRRMPFIFDAATGVENVQGNVQSTKVLRDGQLIIIRNGVEYNANGMMVK